MEFSRFRTGFRTPHNFCDNITVLDHANPIYEQVLWVSLISLFLERAASRTTRRKHTHTHTTACLGCHVKPLHFAWQIYGTSLCPFICTPQEKSLAYVSLPPSPHPSRPSPPHSETASSRLQGSPISIAMVTAGKRPGGLRITSNNF